MLKETIELEKLRQRVAVVDWERLDVSDLIERERPNGKEKKSAEAKLARLNEETRNLMSELHELVAKSPKEALTEWVNWHKGVLDEIIKNEPEQSANTRIAMARFVLGEWKKVLKGEQDFVRINKYFLKDYVAKAEEAFPMDKAAKIEKDIKPEETEKKSSWKFWK